MHETEYAYAVARIRVNELTLLTTSELNQLVNAASYDDAMHKLADKGWKVPENSPYDYAKMLEAEADKAWSLIKEVIPDIHELDMLIVKNDFHNLKAALKCSASGDDPSGYYVKPSCIDTDVITQAVETHDFSILPEYMQNSAQKAYDMVVKVHNGQLADVVLDTAAMETMLNLARNTHRELLIKIADIICVAADIKAAYRIAKTNKGREFAELSLAECVTLDKSSLVEAATEGEEKLIAYLEKTSYSQPADDLKNGDTTAFEKWCDDELMKLVGQAKFTAFGVEPIVAYYIAKDAEIKSVRIILSAKLNNLSADIIKKRVRELYV